MTAWQGRGLIVFWSGTREIIFKEPDIRTAKAFAWLLGN